MLLLLPAVPAALGTARLGWGSAEAAGVAAAAAGLRATCQQRSRCRFASLQQHACSCILSAVA